MANFGGVMEKLKECMWCEGTGEYHGCFCSDCKGTGLAKKCKSCDGTGISSDSNNGEEECPYCEGSGEQS